MRGTQRLVFFGLEPISRHRSGSESCDPCSRYWSWSWSWKVGLVHITELSTADIISGCFHYRICFIGCWYHLYFLEPVRWWVIRQETPTRHLQTVHHDSYNGHMQALSAQIQRGEWFHVFLWKVPVWSQLVELDAVRFRLDFFGVLKLPY